MTSDAVPAHAPLELENFLPYRLSILSNTVSQSIAEEYTGRFQLSMALTVTVAINRNDKDLFPPVVPAAIGIAALVLAALFVYRGRSGRAFAMR